MPDDAGFLHRVQVPPDRETLERIADETGGEYFEALTDSDLADVYEKIGSQVAYDDREREVTAAFAGVGAVLLAAGAALSFCGSAGFLDIEREEVTT